MISFKRKTFWEFYVNISITLVYLSSPSLIINEIATQTGISLFTINVLIFGNIFYLFIRFYPSIRLPNSSKKLLINLLIVLLYLILIWISLYNFNLTGSGPRSFIRVIILILFTLAVMHSKSFNISSFINHFITIAAFISLISVIGWVGIQLGFFHPYWEATVGSHEMIKGFGGYYGTVQEVYSTLSGLQIRNQSYFTEPTNFAQYLSLPLFFSIWRLNNKKNLLSIFYMLIILTAFLLTFSVANYFGILFAIVIYLFLRFPSKELFVKFLYLIIAALGIIGTLKLYDAMNQEEYATIIAKGENAAFEERFSRNVFYFNHILDNPLGDYSYREKNSTNPGFVGFILIAGGFPLLFLMVKMLWPFYWSLLSKLIVGQYSLAYIGVFSYLPPFLWDGQVVEYYFLFHLTFFTLIMSIDKNISNKVVYNNQSA